MIDVESTIFNAVATDLRGEYEGIYVVGESISAPSAFPAVSMYELSNVAYKNSITAESTENHATITYQVDIYSNLVSGKKQQARQIAASVDEKMKELGFVRIYGQPVPNLSDATIYRYTARYKGVISTDYTIFTK